MHDITLLQNVINLVLPAGQRIIDEWQRPGGPRGSGSSAHVDLEIETELKAGLLALLNCDYWGEECGSSLTGDQYCWVVDPHDGTSDFLRGLPGSSVSVGLLCNQRPVLGVVYAPISPDRGKDCLAWVAGLPHLLRNGMPWKVDLSSRQLDSDSLVWVGAAAVRKPFVNEELCAPARFAAMPSVAYRLARAAAGDGVCGVSLAGLGAHDVAGAHALLIGAKGTLLADQGRPLTYQDMDHVSSRCFGGAPAACVALAKRSWHDATRAPSEPSRQFLPVFPDLAKLDRAYGCLAGLLIGDNLGAQVEFMSAARIAQRCAHTPLKLADGGHWNILAGQPTDDGELALCLARSLVELGDYDAEAAAAGYVEWLESHPFDLGDTTRIALLGPRAQPDLPKAQACRQAASKSSQANGALMRVAPIGIAANGDPEKAAAWAREDAALTHAHAVCKEANAAFSAAIAVGVSGGTPDEMFSAAFGVLNASMAAETVRDRIQIAREGHFPDEYMEHMGWVLTALQNAFYHLGRGDDLNEALVETVKRGGDIDTNACITGALLGAAFGARAIAPEHLTVLASCHPTDSSPRPRPIAYWPDVTLELAARLL